MINECVKINLCILVLSVYQISFSRSLISNKQSVKFDQVNSVKDGFRQEKVLGTGRRRKIAIGLSLNNHFLPSFSKVCFNLRTINHPTSPVNRLVFF